MSMVMEGGAIDNKIVRRWEIWNADLGKGVGSKQGGVRPVVIVQNDMGNKHAPTVTIIPMTASKTKKKLPTHVFMSASDLGLYRDSTALAEQIDTIDKRNLEFKITNIPNYMIAEMERAIKVQLGFSIY